jgi:hypothetical protein
MSVVIYLEQMVLFPTRGQNTLDLLLTSHPTIIDKCKALPPLGSDPILFVCLALENAFCRLRSKRLMSVVIYGFDGLFLEIFDGTRSVMINNTIFGDMKSNTKQFWSYLKSKKQDSQGVTPLRKDDGFLYSDTEIFSIASCIWLPMMDLSALFHNKIFLGLERCWCAVSARSISTVSWSLLPNRWRIH